MMSLGSRRAWAAEIEIEAFRGTKSPAAFYTPETPADTFYPAGNSLCYAIQLAHAMGAREIVCVGFTLRNGSGYFFKGANPVTKGSGFWRPELPLEWLRWFDENHPGKVKLAPGFDGPLYQQGLQRWTEDS